MIKMNTDNLKKCPFCGGQPFYESCDRLIRIGCDNCKFYMPFHGIVQSEILTDVIVSVNEIGEACEWYDKDAHDKAVLKWNTRSEEE